MKSWSDSEVLRVHVDLDFEDYSTRILCIRSFSRGDPTEREPRNPGLYEFQIILAIVNENSGAL